MCAGPGSPVSRSRFRRQLALFARQILSRSPQFLRSQTTFDAFGVAQADRLACSNKLLGLCEALAPARIFTLKIGKHSSGFGP